MVKFKYIFCAVLTLLAVSCCYDAVAQNTVTRDMGRGDYGFNDTNNIGDNPFSSEDEENQMPRDTTPKKPKNPLESYFFDMNTRALQMFQWTVSSWENSINMHKIDTTLNMFHVDYPFMKHGVGDINLGFLGGASMPLNFHDRENFRDFQMSAPFYAYIYRTETVPFFNVKRVFTQFGYMTSGQKRVSEDALTITHAQNASPSTGFNISYRQPSIKNRMENQATKLNNVSFAVSHTGKKYTLHTGVIYNKINNRLNGGLIYDEDLDNIDIDLTQNMPVRLTDARNMYKNFSVYAIQSYGIPFVRLTEDDFTMGDVPAVYFGHAIEWNRWTRSYEDTRTGSRFERRVDYYDVDSATETIDYYSNWFFNAAQSRDSIAESRLSNRVFMQIQPWDRNAVIGTINAGVGMDNHSYYYFTPDDFLTGKQKSTKKSSYYTYGSVEGKFRRYFDWRGEIKFVPLGYRNGDLEVGAEAKISIYIGGHPVLLTGKLNYSRSEPAFWSQTFYSNHFIWSNSFGKENVTRFDIALEAPDQNAEIRLSQSVLGDRVYFGSDVVPYQNSGSVSVTSLYARKDFRVGGLHLNHRVLLQWSSNDVVVPVPMLAAYLSYFYEFWVVRDVLRLRLGLDGRYNTKYYAPGYNPATAQFYNQREKQVGNFFVVDAFVSAKWKRMNILLKYEHINEGLLNNSGYFSTAHYPLGKGMFKFGISWNFYN